METPDHQLATFLSNLNRAYRVQLGLRWAAQSLAASFFIDLLLLAAMRMGPLPYNQALLVTVPLLALPAAMIAALVRRPEQRLLALRADSMLGLRERLVTAVELRHDQRAQIFRELQLTDLLRSIGGVRAKQAFPIHLRWRELILLGAPFVALLLLSTTIAQQRMSPDDRSQVREVMRHEAERVKAVADELQSGVIEGDVASFTGAQELRAAGKTLEAKSATPQQAVAALSEAEQRLLGLRDQHATALQQALAQAAQGLQQQGETSKAGSQLASGDVASAIQSLRDMASKVRSASGEERANIAQALNAAAKGASPLAPSLGESLRQAADAVQSGDAHAQNALERAAGEIGQAGKSAAAADRLDKAIAQLQDSKSAIGQATPQTRQQDSLAAAGDTPPGGSARDSEPTSRGARVGGGQTPDGESRELGEQGAGEGSIDSTTDVFSPRPLGVHVEQDSSPQMDRPTVSDSEKTGAATLNEATVDYRDVFAAYRDQATAAAQDRYIPLDLKNIVRDYFSSLGPGK